MQITFEPDAEADLAKAREWYRRQRAGLDLAFMRRIDEALRRVLSAPYSYPLTHRQLRRVTLRQFPFAIFYQPTIDEIRVFAVYHSRRDSRKLKSRLRS